MPSFVASATSRETKPQNRWLILILCASAYFFVMLHRLSTGVIVADFKQEFHATATQLGLLSSVYFYVYAALQIPVGIVTDRIGAKKVICGGLWIAVLGAGLFALSHSLVLAILARAVVSLGVAAIYVPSLRLLLEAFGPQFSTATGLLIAVGQTGGLVASTPLALAVQAFGWRGAFTAIGALTLAVSLLVLFGLKTGGAITHARADLPARVERLGKSRTGGRGSAGSGPIWWGLGLLGGITFFCYGPANGYQGIWGIPFLMDVYHLPRVGASNIVALSPLGNVIASFLMGIFIDRITIKKGTLILTFALGSFLAWIPLAFHPTGLSHGLLSVLSLMMGMGISGSAVPLYGLAPTFIGTRNKAAALGLLNTCTMGGGAVFQLLMGWLIDLTAHGARGVAGQYQTAFLAGFLGVIVGLACAVAIRTTQRNRRGTYYQMSS